MAFVSTSLELIASQPQRVWKYISKDSLQDILRTGYFTDARLLQDDIIVFSPTTQKGGVHLVVTQASGGVATARFVT
jgi:hypothetical protein